MCTSAWKTGGIWIGQWTASVSVVWLWCGSVVLQNVNTRENHVKGIRDFSTLFLMTACEPTIISRYKTSCLKKKKKAGALVMGWCVTSGPGHIHQHLQMSFIVFPGIYSLANPAGKKVFYQFLAIAKWLICIFIFLIIFCRRLSNLLTFLKERASFCFSSASLYVPLCSINICSYIFFVHIFIYLFSTFSDYIFHLSKWSSYFSNLLILLPWCATSFLWFRVLLFSL